MAAGAGGASPIGFAVDGHAVFTPTLTGLGERSHLLRPDIDLATHVADVVSVMRWERLSEVVLCGHSYGGFVISGVAEMIADRIRSIVFLDAFLPANSDTILELTGPAVGTPFARLCSGASSACRRGRRRRSASMRPTANGSTIFACRSRSRPSRRRSHLMAHASASRAKTYIRAKAYDNPAFDRALSAVQSDPSWRCHEVDCGHDVMVDMPDRLTELLLQAAA